LFESQGRQYFYVVLGIGILQCVICIFLEKDFDKQENLARRVNILRESAKSNNILKVSPWSLLILNAFDLYFLLATAYFFMVWE